MEESYFLTCQSVIWFRNWYMSADLGGHDRHSLRLVGQFGSLRFRAKKKPGIHAFFALCSSSCSYSSRMNAITVRSWQSVDAQLVDVLSLVATNIRVRTPVLALRLLVLLCRWSADRLDIVQCERDDEVIFFRIAFPEHERDRLAVPFGDARSRRLVQDSVDAVAHRCRRDVPVLC